MFSRRFASLSILWALALPLFSAQDNRRDGNWWRARPRATKLAYLVGFFDGMELGERFSYWGLPQKDGKMNPATGDIGESYDKMYSQYIKNVTSGQMVDGVDKFYEDYRNRSIRIYDALWIVANMISGKSDAEMQTMIESFRKLTN